MTGSFLIPKEQDCPSELSQVRDDGGAGEGKERGKKNEVFTLEISPIQTEK
jgi:hypothetical protein